LQISGRPETLATFFQVNNVDLIAMTENKWGHLW